MTVEDSRQCGALREREAAKYLAVSERTLYTLRQTGQIDYFRVGRAIRYRKDALDGYMTRQEERHGRATSSFHLNQGAETY